MLVKDLKDRIYSKILSINSTIEESIDFVIPSPPSGFEARISHFVIPLKNQLQYALGVDLGLIHCTIHAIK